MTKTLISSDKQEIIIGFDAPFCVIGERINPTGRKLLAAEMAEGNYDRVISDACHLCRCHCRRQNRDAAERRFQRDRGLRPGSQQEQD